MLNLVVHDEVVVHMEVGVGIVGVAPGVVGVNVLLGVLLGTCQIDEREIFLSLIFFSY